MKITDRELLTLVWYNQLKKIADATASLDAKKSVIISSPDALKKNTTLLNQSFETCHGITKIISKPQLKKRILALHSEGQIHSNTSPYIQEIKHFTINTKTSHDAIDKALMFMNEIVPEINILTHSDLDNLKKDCFYYLTDIFPEYSK